MEVDKAKDDVKQVLSPNAKVFPLVTTKRLLIIDSVANLRTVSELLNQERMIKDGRIVPDEFRFEARRAGAGDRDSVSRCSAPTQRPSRRPTPEQMQQQQQMMQQMQQQGQKPSKMTGQQKARRSTSRTTAGGTASSSMRRLRR